MAKIKLAFGAQWLVPETVTTAWGARWIFPNDMLFDRQDLTGPDIAHLKQWLNSGAIAKARSAAALAAKRFRISPDSSVSVILYKDAGGVIVGSPNSSYGYLYVAAWLHNNEPNLQPVGMQVVGENTHGDIRKEVRNRSSRINAAMRELRSRQ